MTIKLRLILLATLVTASMLLQLALLQYGTNMTGELKDLHIKTEETRSGMLLLRRHEKDFLARLDLKYVEEFRNDHNTVVAKLGELSTHMVEYDIDKEIAGRVAAILNDYKTTFFALVAVQQTIGLNEKEGLYGSLRKAVHNVENTLNALNDDRLSRMMLTLRRNEKDFMLREDLKYRDKLEGNLAKMRDAVKASGYSIEAKEAINGQLDIYERDFKALVAGYVKKGLSSKEGLRGKMRETVHQTETSLDQVIDTIVTNTNSELARVRLFGDTFSLAIIVLSLLVTATLARSVLKPTHKMQAVIARIRSDNDLSLRVDIQGKNEVASMGHDFNLLLAKFQNVIETIFDSTTHVSATAEELSLITDETNGRMQQQMKDTDTVASAIEEMSASVQEVVNSANETAQTTKQAEQSVERGGQVVSDTVASINLLAGDVSRVGEVIGNLEQESLNIGTVLDVIRGIAEQTNLLALNAAIEAARAGEQGRGFAVVADEVRNLASRTQQSTHEIQAMIEKLQEEAREAVSAMERGKQSAETGVTRANEANVALSEITTAISTIHDMASHIVNASQQQGQVAGEVAQSISTIKHSVDETGHSVDHITQASGNLAQLATQLHGLVSHYKI